MGTRQKRESNRRFDSIGQVLRGYLAQSGYLPKIDAEKAVVMWPQIVGEAIARVTEAQRMEEGKLFVRVKSATWRNELSLLKPQIIDQVNAKLNGKVVEDIRFI